MTHVRSRRIVRFVSFAVLFGVISACDRQGGVHTAIEFSGATMGTTYSVTVADEMSAEYADRLQETIGARLAQLEGSMSTYVQDSELSKFNNSSDSSWFVVSPLLCTAIDEAVQISRTTDGAFDVTVGPLVNLWGFGPATADKRPPGDAEIAAAILATGYDKLQVDCREPAIRKLQPSVYVDLSAYAKGLAVDVISDLLLASGKGNHLVEIGGEIRARGSNASGDGWRIAIEKPHDTERTVQRVVSISDQAMATSGNYRNFYISGGQRFSHTIDPRSGRPVDHNLAAVTVVRERAAVADALATALLVMGPVRGPEFAERNEIAALFVVADGALQKEQMTTTFHALLEH